MYSLPKMNVYQILNAGNVIKKNKRLDSQKFDNFSFRKLKWKKFKLKKNSNTMYTLYFIR